MYDNTECKELLETLEEVRSIMENCSFTDILWNGDFNWDRARSSRFANILEKIMVDMNLVDVWDNFSVSHTHIHTDYKSTSTIDRILVNEKLVDCISDASAI